jgi:peptide-methionine (R)-S-oxide reductase
MIMKILTGSLMALAGALILVSMTGATDGETMKGKTLRLYSVKDGGYVELPADNRSPAEWKKILTPEQFGILRKEGTERAFTGKLLKEHRHGIFKCAGCGTDLFSSETKYDSGTGWPSFWQPVASENIREVEDNSFFMRRVEIECARCGGHLGHVFTDGPPPTGLRYCINSASLTFAEGLPGKTGGVEGGMMQ